MTQVGSIYEHARWREPSGATLNRRRRSALRVDAFLLLGGGLRPDPLSRATGRPLLDMPVERGRTLLDWWMHHAADVARRSTDGVLPMRVMIDASQKPPTIRRSTTRIRCDVQRDLSDFRGVGGLLRDVAATHGDDDMLLVANASQPIVDPWPQAIATLAKARADIALMVDSPGGPTGLMLIRCGALRSVAPICYGGFKEQALPQLARLHDVRIVRSRSSAIAPMRTSAHYLAGLNQLNTPRHGSTFAVTENGSNVHPDARLNHCVVLRGASVGAGAVVSRSVICGGAQVPAGAVVVDRVVTA